MDGPEGPANVNCTALHSKDMRGVIDKIIKAVEREDGASAELM